MKRMSQAFRLNKRLAERVWGEPFATPLDLAARLDVFLWIFGWQRRHHLPGWTLVCDPRGTVAVVLPARLFWYAYRDSFQFLRLLK